MSQNNNKQQIQTQEEQLQQLISQNITQQKKGSNLSDLQLKNLNYNKLPQEEIEMLEKLSFFSSHNYLYKILANQFGEAKAKEQFVMDNLGYISQDDSADYTIAKRQYTQNSIKIPSFIMGTCTISAFMFGLWTLPSRVSTFKYTAIGFGIGLVASYGYWRYSMNKYYDTLNTHFKRIIKEKYLQNKYAEKYTEK